MIILGIETSCDETACAIVQNNADSIQILSNIVASSQHIHIKYGGIVPEQASREQIKSIIPVITECLEQAKLTPEEIDAIAVTQGPGLIGSLLVGVEAAKTLSLIWQKPLIPVNHLLAHFYTNWTQGQPPMFPCIGLLVSGGHTDLVLFKDHGDYLYLGGTRDDAAGECFDKSARLLDLPYPGGPHLSKLAEDGDLAEFTLPKPMWDSKDLDFSFSGLKTAVANIIIQHQPLTDQRKANLACSLENMIVSTLIRKTIEAARIHNIENIIISGGVAANRRLTEAFLRVGKGIKIHIPPPHLCTDNAVMVATNAFFLSPVDNPLSIEANPNLSLRK
jgi:N6-L-threonylcarbamoyladenine synthase